MAPINPSSHTFQKLKLDTHTPQKSATSTLNAISRPEAKRQGSLSSLFHGASEVVVDASLHRYRNGTDKPEREDRANGQPPRPYDHASAGVGANDFEVHFSARKTSITFDREVTLDCGNRLSAGEPLPRSSPSEDGDGREDLDNEYSQSNTFTTQECDGQHPVRQRINGSGYSVFAAPKVIKSPRFPYTEQDQVASLTSAATASPLSQEPRTPPDLAAESLFSPLQPASPVDSAFSFSRRSLRTRARGANMGESEPGTRRTSRRSSTVSGRSLSSMSPAASFLSRYKASERPLKPVEPDDEGQGIGYSGEYIIGKQIGYGGFSIVKEVTTIEHGVKVVHAVKIVRKQLMDKSELENEQIQSQFDHEVEIWRYLRHPYILPLLRVYNTDFATFCITRLNKGGTLFDLVRETRKKKQKGIPLHLAKRYTYQLGSAIRYLHNDVLVVHRDIKLENCLVDMSRPNAETEGGDVLLCDFGMADFIISDQRDSPEPHSVGENPNIGPADTSTSVAGSLQYAAPELFNAVGSVFSPAADIWAFGVVIFALLTAQLPFDQGLDAKTSMRIQKGEWDIDLLRGSEALQAGAEDAIALVRGCLEMDPMKRWTIGDVLGCDWLKGCMQKYEGVDRPWLASS